MIPRSRADLGFQRRPPEPLGGRLLGALHLRGVLRRQRAMITIHNFLCSQSAGWWAPFLGNLPPQHRTTNSFSPLIHTMFYFSSFFNK
jgi:hypothetical protein